MIFQCLLTGAADMSARCMLILATPIAAVNYAQLELEGSSDWSLPVKIPCSLDQVNLATNCTQLIVINGKGVEAK